MYLIKIDVPDEHCHVNSLRQIAANLAGKEERRRPSDDVLRTPKFLLLASLA